VPGGSLRDLLKKRDRLDWRETASLGAGIARGLAAIHAAGLVHRDLKPENVLLDANGTPKITDLGLVGAHAAALAVSHALTKTGEVLGTLAYMAPEQADGQRQVTPGADLYALGAVLYEALTGGPVFRGTGYGLMKKHLVETPRSPSEAAPGIPEAL